MTTTYEVCDDTWQAGKHYSKGDIIQLSEAPQGEWCKPVEKQSEQPRQTKKLKEYK